MPFTGTGTGIQNADDIFFSSVTNNNILRFNGATAKWNNVPVAIVTADVTDDTVTEPKLAVSNAPSTNFVLSWNGAAMAWVAQATVSDATTLAKGVVQLVGDLGGTAASPTVPGLAGKEPTITAGTTAQYYRGDKSWQALNKTAVGLANVDNTTDASKPISTLTQTALNAKAATATTVTGTNSISGGGDLSANRTLALVNDAAAPGNSKYYGTDGTGTRGFFSIPAGDPAVGGDLTGTASNAQIAGGAVGATELAPNAVTTVKIIDDAVTEPKLAMANSPATGQVLSWNGAAMAWAGALAFAFTRTNVSANYTVTAPFQYVFADATTAGITVTLPAPQLNAYVRVKRMSSGANGVQIVAPGGSYLDAVAVGSDVLQNQYDSAEYWSDGVNWYR